MTIGDRIRAKRLELDLTLEDVSKVVGITRQTVQKYESGIVSNIPSDKIELLAKALKTTPGYLMGWEQIGLAENETRKNEKPAAQEGDELWHIIESDPTKRELAHWISRLEGDDLLRVAKILAAILEK